MNNRQYARIGGWSYVVIFFTAIYANFFVLEALKTDPVGAAGLASYGAVAFMVAAVFDVFVAWALWALYTDHEFTVVSTMFRVMHAVIMGAAAFALVPVVTMTDAAAILEQVMIFNHLWLIGLFFFGVHLLFLGRIVKEIQIIPYFLMLAGAMYMLDTVAQFTLTTYDNYATIFLTLVAIPSIVGEMAFGLWLLLKGGK